MIKFFSRQIDTNAFFQFISSLSVKSQPRFELAGQKKNLQLKNWFCFGFAAYLHCRIFAFGGHFIEFITIFH